MYGHYIFYTPFTFNTGIKIIYDNIPGTEKFPHSNHLSDIDREN